MGLLLLCSSKFLGLLLGYLDRLSHRLHKLVAIGGILLVHALQLIQRLALDDLKIITDSKVGRASLAEVPGGGTSLGGLGNRCKNFHN